MGLDRLIRQWFRVLVVVLTALGSTSAWAQGEPPSWKELISGADLIVRAKVVEQGRWGASFEVERTFWGQAPSGRFAVVGFNDPAFPPPGIDNESMRLGEVYWLFLNPFDGGRDPLELPTWQASEVGTPSGRTYTTPSTIAGEVPERDGAVLVNLLHAGYAHFGEPMPRGEWEPLLEAMVGRFRAQQEPTALLTAQASCLDGPVSPVPDQPFVETPDVQCLGRLLLLGHEAWDDRLLKWARGAAPQAMGAAAALANRSGSDRAQMLLRAAALDIQGSAALPMINDARERGPEAQNRIARAIVGLLPASREETPPPEPATLTQIRSEDTRMNLLQVLVSVSSTDSAADLLQELRYLNPASLRVGIEALERAEPGSWVPAAFALLASPDRARVRTVFEAVDQWRPAAARDPLHAFLARNDLPPDLEREALTVLGTIGDASSAALIRARLMPRLAFDGAWDDDRVDMVAAELSALSALSPEAAEEAAWTVARQYLGLPRSWATPSHRAAGRLERAALERAAVAVMPAGSSARVRVVSSKDGPLEDRGTRLVLVDGETTAGNSSALKSQVAGAAGTEPNRVRLCGPDLRGKVRCGRSRGPHWVPHQRLASAVVRTIGALAGLGPQGVDRPGPDPVMWLAIAELEGVLEATSTVHVVDDLWDARFSGPVSELETPPLVPELPPLGPRPMGGP